MTPARRNQNWLPSIFNDVFGNEWIEKSSVMVPAVNILENEDEYKVEMAVAGLTKDGSSCNRSPTGFPGCQLSGYVLRGADRHYRQHRRN